MIENEDIIYWIQFLCDDGQWQDCAGHHSLRIAKEAMSHRRELTPNTYRIVKRVTTVLEDET